MYVSLHSPRLLGRRHPSLGRLSGVVVISCDMDVLAWPFHMQEKRISTTQRRTAGLARGVGPWQGSVCAACGRMLGGSILGLLVIRKAAVAKTTPSSIYNVLSEI